MEQVATDRIMDTQIKHTHQKKYPTVSSCQSKPTPSLGQVAHEGPSSAKVSSSLGGTQRNGDHCFLRGEE